MCLQRKRQAVTLPRAIYKPFWMNWAILGLLSLHHSQPLLHLLSHFLVCSLSFILFLLSGFPSAVFVTYSSETNALFIPPPGCRNTSFPVAWYRGARVSQDRWEPDTNN